MGARRSSSWAVVALGALPLLSTAPSCGSTDGGVPLTGERWCTDLPVDEFIGAVDSGYEAVNLGTSGEPLSRSDTTLSDLIGAPDAVTVAARGSDWGRALTEPRVRVSGALTVEGHTALDFTMSESLAEVATGPNSTNAIVFTRQVQPGDLLGPLGSGVNPDELPRLGQDFAIRGTPGGDVEIVGPCWMLDSGADTPEFVSLSEAARATGADSGWDLVFAIAGGSERHYDLLSEATAQMRPEYTRQVELAEELLETVADGGDPFVGSAQKDEP